MPTPGLYPRILQTQFQSYIKAEIKIEPYIKFIPKMKAYIDSTFNVSSSNLIGNEKITSL